jgi:large subunit ribosomal protein L35
MGEGTFQAFQGRILLPPGASVSDPAGIENARKRAGSEIGAPQGHPSRGASVQMHPPFSLSIHFKLTLAPRGIGRYSLRPFLQLIYMRRPKGIKTKKAAAKRFKITATGKVLRSHAGRRHLAQTKNAKRLRRLGKSAVVDKTDTYRITQSMPFSHRG